MITGAVNDDHEAVVEIILQSARGHLERVLAVVDTGFNGRLTLPRMMITTFGLRWHGEGRAVLADGNEIFSA